MLADLDESSCPSLEQSTAEGEVGQARITQYTRYLTVGLAIGQSIGYVFLFHSLSSASQPIIPIFDLQHIMLIVVSLTAGIGPRDVDGRVDHAARDR